MSAFKNQLKIIFAKFFDRNQARTAMSLQFDPSTQQNIDQWLTGPYDADTKSIIQELIKKEDQITLTDSFYKSLEFGTGGMRGEMGVGCNRMNRYTVGAATQGFANYLLKSLPEQSIKVAIAHDSRNNSPEFTRIAADIFTANGIEVYLFNDGSKIRINMNELKIID